MLTSELSLMHFNPELEIILALHDSDDGIGAVIGYKFRDDKIKSLPHASTNKLPAMIDYFWF